VFYLGLLQTILEVPCGFNSLALEAA